jgi:transposase
VKRRKLSPHSDTRSSDHAYQEAGFTPVVPPKQTRKEPWDYDEELYKRRNEVERLFRKLKGFRRIFTRFEKLDVMFKAFLLLALAFLIL